MRGRERRNPGRRGEGSSRSVAFTVLYNTYEPMLQAAEDGDEEPVEKPEASRKPKV